MQLTLQTQLNGPTLLPGPLKLTPRSHSLQMESTNNGSLQDGVFQAEMLPQAMLTISASQLNQQLTLLN